MYNQVNLLPITGIGAVGSGVAAYSMGGPWFWVFAALAVFTMIGAFGALVRTLPAMRMLHREPKKFAPEGRPERSGGSHRFR
jgi:hypothetical protein